MSNDEFESRREELEMIAQKYQKSGLEYPDIRDRYWIKKDCDAGKILDCLIKAEDMLNNLDEFQMNHDQCYPDIEDMMLQIGELRKHFTDYVDSNPELLDIKNK